jgi:hypothetical protein
MRVMLEALRLLSGAESHYPQMRAVLQFGPVTEGGFTRMGLVNVLSGKVWELFHDGTMGISDMFEVNTQAEVESVPKKREVCIMSVFCDASGQVVVGLGEQIDVLGVGEQPREYFVSGFNISVSGEIMKSELNR